jgi:predicted anti-sigma-YlaC factor YlaD
MRCSEATRQLQLYLDNQLTVHQVRTLEAHLALCVACRDDLLLLEEVVSVLSNLKPIAEPADLMMHIMQRVAMSSQHENKRYSLFRPSLMEMLAAILLATITTLGIIWEQPSLRAALPFANGHDSLSQTFFNTLNMLLTGHPATLILGLWVIGTILGICITLALVGGDIRAEWLKAMMERLPVR